MNRQRHLAHRKQAGWGDWTNYFGGIPVSGITCTLLALLRKPL